MKKKTILIVILSIVCFGSCCDIDDTFENENNSKPFISIWKTDESGYTEDNQIEIPGFGRNYKIYWEEIGNLTNNGTETATNSHTITFPKSGIYKVYISGGTPAFHQIKFSSPLLNNNKRDNNKIISIEQWGNIEWSSFDHAFCSCYALEINWG